LCTNPEPEIQKESKAIMSKPKGVTQKMFNPYVLGVVAELSNYTPDREVARDQVFGPVCALAGVTEDQFGNTPEGPPWTHRLIGLAFRSLREKGYADYVKRGVWVLTQKGIDFARSQTGNPLVDALDQLEDEELEEEPLSISKVMVGEKPEGTVIRLTQLPAYHADPYIKALAIEQTPCFGAHANQSSICKTCPIASDCRTAAMGTKAKIAEDFEAAERALAAKLAVAAKLVAKDSESIDDLIDQLDPDKGNARNRGAVAAPKRMGRGQPSKFVAQSDMVCLKCQRKIKKGDEAFWTKSESGVYHPGCFQALKP